MAHCEISTRIERSLWPALLIAVSAIGTLGFACVTPFAAFAVAAAYGLPAGAALFAVAGIWFANQAIGFGALGYPWTADTILWGFAIGVSALIATAFAALALRKLAKRSVAVSIGTALLIAFVVYESGLFMVTFGLGGQEAFTPTIVGTFALLNLAVAVALVGARERLRYLLAMVQPWPAPTLRCVRPGRSGRPSRNNGSPWPTRRTLRRLARYHDHPLCSRLSRLAPLSTLSWDSRYGKVKA